MHAYAYGEFVLLGGMTYASYEVAGVEWTGKRVRFGGRRGDIVGCFREEKSLQTTFSTETVATS